MVFWPYKHNYITTCILAQTMLTYLISYAGILYSHLIHLVKLLRSIGNYRPQQDLTIFCKTDLQRKLDSILSS